MGTVTRSLEQTHDETGVADPAVPPSPELEVDRIAMDGSESFEAPAPSVWPQRILAILLILGTVGWIAAAAWRAATAFGTGKPDLQALMQGVATLSMPLALIGIAWLLLRRTDSREARQFERTAAAMRTEVQALEHVLAQLNGRIEENRRSLGDHANELLSIGEDTGTRLAAIAEAMRQESAELAQQTGRLESAARGARADMAALLQDLPRAGAEAREIARLLTETGAGAQERVDALSTTLAAIGQRGSEVEALAGGAAQRLAAHLANVEGAGAAVADRLVTVGQQLQETVGAALGQAAAALEESRGGVEAQNAAALAMIEQARIALRQAGSDSARAIGTHVSDIGTRVDGLSAKLAAQAEMGGNIVGMLDDGLAALETRFGTLGRTGQAQAVALDASLTALGTSADHINAALENGVGRAEHLVLQAETVTRLLQDGSADLSTTLPDALDRFESRVTESRAALAALVPEAARLAASASEAAARLSGADAVMLRQATTLRALGLAAEERLAAIHDQAAKLEAAISGSGDQVRQLADSAGPRLIDALLRVRETAVQAADHAREAFVAVIPDAADVLGRTVHEALSGTIDQQIAARMAEVAAASERAVQATQRATERLMRQMLTIADTTAVIETRIAEAKAEAEEADEETFSRRVGLLIDQLNSTSINVTGVLSQEVAEASWAAYLKGDRGIFTRRAVRLLDGAEAREIQRLYEEDEGFRDTLNRYVHDFEAMLRRVLANREGSQLGVTLLSSDMGKLYVALAQAIERLRT